MGSWRFEGLGSWRGCWHRWSLLTRVGLPWPLLAPVAPVFRWPALASVGLHWLPLASVGSLRSFPVLCFVGPRWLLLAPPLFGRRWPPIGPRWPQLAPVGPCWSPVGPIGLRWPLLAPVDLHCPLLPSVGPISLWLSLAPIGLRWPPLASVGLCYEGAHNPLPPLFTPLFSGVTGTLACCTGSYEITNPSALQSRLRAGKTF